MEYIAEINYSFISRINYTDDGEMLIRLRDAYWAKSDYSNMKFKSEEEIKNHAKHMVYHIQEHMLYINKHQIQKWDKVYIEIYKRENKKDDFVSDKVLVVSERGVAVQ